MTRTDDTTETDRFARGGLVDEFRWDGSGCDYVIPRTRYHSKEDMLAGAVERLKDPLQPDDMDALRAKLEALKAARENRPVNREPCCDDMRRAADFTCDAHADPYDCPDVLVIQSGDGSYGLIVHDGGTSSIEIRFCPWCGTRLPVAVI